jgi:site-specific recombinase XerD
MEHHDQPGDRSDPGRRPGPLELFEAALRADLGRQGFTPRSVRTVVAAMRRLSGWMEQHTVRASGLSPQKIEEFTAAISDEKAANRGLGTLVRLLRGQGAIPPAAGADGTPAGLLLTQYRQYLAGERGLAPESVRCYLSQAGEFLAALPGPLDESLRRLDPAAVIGFVCGHAARAGSVQSAKALVTRVRSLLRFLHVHGMIAGPLAGAVPGVAGWRLSALPRGLDPGQVAAIVAAPDPRTGAGLRDQAILMLLARLGLRGAEAAALTLADVDWHAGEITVRGKGSRIETMPFPADAGEALAAYLTRGRPRCPSTSLFITARAPYHGIDGSVVRAAMGRACLRAGLPRTGAHRLRHSLATGVLQAGAPLSEVGQLLRHRSDLSTSVYAKVDYASLMLAARPWPLPAAQEARS